MQTTIDTTTHPTIARLVEIQGEEKDKAFSSKYLSVSETTWYRLRTGSYDRAQPTRALKKLANDLAELNDHLALTNHTDRGKILPLHHIESVRDALHIAFAEPRNRLVLTLADTGGGKTACCNAIAELFPGRVATVEASEPWRSSYLAGIHNTAAACGLGEIKNVARMAEAQLIEELTARPRIITIDEANYLGSACLNLVKLILNRTSSTIALFALPALWDYITRSSQQEARQLRNRTAAFLHFKSCRAADVRIVCEATIPTWASLGDGRTAAINRIKAAADGFGLWNTVFGVAEFIADDASGKPVTSDMVERAIRDISTLRK